MGDETEVERLLHGICDALKFLPAPSKNAGTAVLRGLLKGTSHDGHSDDNWTPAALDASCPTCGRDRPESWGQ